MSCIEAKLVARVIQNARERPQRRRWIARRTGDHKVSAGRERGAVGDGECDAARKRPAADIHGNAELVVQFHPFRLTGIGCAVNLIERDHAVRRGDGDGTDG